MVCISIHNLQSESGRSDDKLNVEDENEQEDDEDNEEEDDDDDNGMSLSLLPSHCDSFKEQREVSSASDEVSIMVRRALFSSIRIASHIM